MIREADVVTYVAVRDPGDEAMTVLTQFARTERPGVTARSGARGGPLPDFAYCPLAWLTFSLCVFRAIACDVRVDVTGSGSVPAISSPRGKALGVCVTTL